ncbi:enolase C-terminal domain-like protein [Nakamurella aerolata]
MVISGIDTVDVRFPTSQFLDGSDAMNPDPDYSAAYLRVDLGVQGRGVQGRGVQDHGVQEQGVQRQGDHPAAPDGDLPSGHAFVFTIGRGNDIQLAAVASVAERLIGRPVRAVLDDLGGLWRELVHDSQLRWLGPEKGVMQMAIGAVVNAMWDLKAKLAGKPLWLLLSEMPSEALVDLVDFRYLTDVLTPEQALSRLRRWEDSRGERIEALRRNGYPAYTTTPGWLGYSDEKLARLCAEAVQQGFAQIKLKVGGNVADDRRRMAIAREVVGTEIRIATDANQRWETAEAIEWVRQLAEFDPVWIEEPTNPDDLLAHAEIARGVAPIRVATGEHMANRVMFKQFLQAGALQVAQIDATRVAGVNENLAMLLLAAQFDVPVCPHAGGVGLCEAVQHLSMFDYVAVSGTVDGRVIEYVDHLHEHFVTPVELRQGNYVAPLAPGAGTEMLPASLERYRWSGRG